jgi:hypothetical protein
VFDADEEEVVTRHDRSGVIRYASSSLTRLTRHCEASLLGRRGEDFVHEDDLPELLAAVHAARRGANATAAMFRFSMSCGGYVWLDARFQKAPRPAKGREVVCIARPVAVSAT